MAFLTTLASVLGIEVNELVASSKRSALLWTAIALFGLIGLTFGLVAAYFGLSLWVGPIWAALIIAGAALLAAAVIFLVWRHKSNIAHKREVQRRRSAETTALVTTAAASALPLVLRSPLMRSIGIPVGAALAALYFAHRGDRRTEPND